MRRVPHSFELYPPRSAAVAAALPGVLDGLAATRPDFVSVTYGASGSAPAASFDLVRLVRQRIDVDVMAHLTCGGLTRAGAAEVVERLLDLGVNRFLALRGDLVDGRADAGLSSAADLVRLVRETRAERVRRAAPHRAGAGGIGVLEDDGPRTQVAVAAFVNGYPGAGAGTAHLDALLAKQEAGADSAITQLFFHADDYAAFVERAAQAGVTIPILPGVLPITGPARLARVIELSGEESPRELAAALDREPTAEGRRRIGVEHATRLAAGLIEAGAPGIHLYTFNRADAVLDVLHDLGLVPDTHPTKETP